MIGDIVLFGHVMIKMANENELHVVEARNKITNQNDMILCIKAMDREKGIWVKTVACLFTFTKGDNPFEIYDKDSEIMTGDIYKETDK